MINAKATNAINSNIEAIDKQLYTMGYREDPEEAAELLELLNRCPESEIQDARLTELGKNLCCRVFPGIRMYARDVNLPEDAAEKYEEGMILRSPVPIEASRLNGGMVTSHRFAILSNHMADMSAAEGGEDPRGLALAQRDSYFQVLKIHRSGSGETMILLLHLPGDGSWPFFEKVKLTMIDDIVDDSIDRFENWLIEPPVEELTTEEWFKCCSAPVGIDENGNIIKP